MHGVLNTHSFVGSISASPSLRSCLMVIHRTLLADRWASQLSWDHTNFPNTSIGDCQQCQDAALGNF